MSYLALNGGNMNKIITALLFIYNVTALAGFKSPFPSSIEGLDLPNAHFVNASKTIIRSMAPHGYIKMLKKIGVNEVIIFKNQTRNEVDKEIVELNKNGITKIHHIPFRWNKIASFSKACKQTVRALKIMKRVDNTKNGKLLFHCTVGEDRTGFLAGIWDMLNNGLSHLEAFKSQMCQRGFAHGNPKKPYYVIKQIRQGLTPLYIQMARLIDKGDLALNNLDESVCEKHQIQLVEEIPTCPKADL